MDLNFKYFFEMSHLIPRHNGKLAPFLLHGKYVQSLDMKFETYPDSKLKNRLLLSNREKFYAKIPDLNLFLIFDGKNLDTAHNPPDPIEYIKLPDDWFQYAVFEFVDGSILEPH